MPTSWSRAGRRPRCRRSASAGSAAARALSTPQRRSRRPRAARGTWAATASSWAKAPASSCSRSWSTRRRAARSIYCELAGYGMSADAHHITAPPEDGDGARRSMVNALKNARDGGRRTSTTSTRTARRRRSATSPSASRSSARSATTRRSWPSSSTKSMTGHLLGAAGGVEAVFTRARDPRPDRAAHRNLFERDPQCDLDFVPLSAAEDDDPRRAVELVRLRRHQRDARVPRAVTARRGSGIAARRRPHRI